MILGVCRVKGMTRKGVGVTSGAELGSDAAGWHSVAVSSVFCRS